MFHPCRRHDIKTTAAVFCLTSSRSTARSSLYSWQPGIPSCQRQHVERLSSPRHICIGTRSFQTASQDFPVFSLLPKPSYMTCVLVSFFLHSLWTLQQLILFGPRWTPRKWQWWSYKWQTKTTSIKTQSYFVCIKCTQKTDTSPAQSIRDIVWISPEENRSTSVSRRFFLPMPQQSSAVHRRFSRGIGTVWFNVLFRRRAYGKSLNWCKKTVCPTNHSAAKYRNKYNYNQVKQNKRSK